MKAFVIGAGPSGISLAWFLSKQNWEVVLIEKESHVGGLGSSKKKFIKGKEISLDSGPHIFHTNDKEMINIWKKNFSNTLSEKLLFSANCKGKEFIEFHDYPISKQGLKKQNIEISEVTNKIINPFLFTNYRDYMKARVGEEIEKEYFRKYPKKLWGIKTNLMRADWAPKRIEIREKIEPFFVNQWVGTSKYGSGFVYEKMKRDILRNKGQVLTQRVVEEFVLDNSLIKKINTNKGQIEIQSDSIIISCVPSKILGKILKRNFNCKYRGVIIISCLHKINKLPSDYSWIYFDSEKICFTRVTNFSKLSPNASNNLNIFMYEIPFDSEKDVNKNDLELIFKNSLEKVKWLNDSFSEIIDINVEKYVYPLRELGYERNIAKINSYADSINNLIRSGTAAEFEYGDVQICFRKSLDLSNDLKTHPKVIRNLQNKFKSHNIYQKSKIENYGIHKNTMQFIAEIGINHNGSIDLAKKLIDMAAKARCDFAKFQLYSAETRANKFTRDAFYKEDADGEGENLYEIFKRCELKFEDMRELYLYGEKAGLKVFFSAFDRQSVIKAHQINPLLLKISSMDLTNFEVCDEASNLFKEIIMSTGMSTLEDIEKSSSFIKNKIGENLTLLHCISSYPMDINSICLGTIPLLKKFVKKVGYSDHSLEPFTALLALASGAQIIEKHITLDKKLTGPDHIHSLEENELEELVSNIHNFKNMLKARKDLIGVEYKEYLRQKKGYYYKRDIEGGKILESDDLILMPPCLGDDTFEISKNIGKKILSSKNKFDPAFRKDC